MEAIRLPASGPAWVELRTNEISADKPLPEVVVTLHGEGLEATKVGDLHSYFSNPGDPRALASFFRDMAKSWRGWQGVRQWSSLDHDLIFDCTHDAKGTVRVVATLIRYPHLDEWRVSLAFELAGGTSLELLASDLRAFLRI